MSESNGISNEELSKIVKSEVDKAIQSKGGVSGDGDFSRKLDDISSKLGNIAEANKKRADSAKFSMIANCALLVIVVIIFGVLTSNLVTLLKNLDATMTAVNGTVAEVTGLVSSADETVKGINVMLDDISKEVNRIFNKSCTN